MKIKKGFCEKPFTVSKKIVDKRKHKPYAFMFLYIHSVH